MTKFTVTIHRKDQAITKEVMKDSFTIGRSLDCDLSLNDTHVSRVHLVVSRRWNQIFIEDKNSSNGTFLNGNKMVQGTPVNITSSDKLQLGRSEFILVFDLETDEVAAPMPELEPEPEPVPVPDVPVARKQEANPLTPSLSVPKIPKKLDYEEKTGHEDTIAMPAPNQAPFQAEKILHDAKRAAAQIVLEGEKQAEKRTQAIYQKARDAQAQAEIFHQTRIAEAHKEADAILADYQRQGHQLLHDARNMAQELREEVDVYVQSLRQKAKADVEDIISEATLAAEKMKTEALEQARQTAQNENAATIKEAKDEAVRIIEFARMQAQQTHEQLVSVKEDLLKNSSALAVIKDDLETARTALAKTLADTTELKQTSEAEYERRKQAAEAEYLSRKEAAEREFTELREKSTAELRKLEENIDIDRQTLDSLKSSIDDHTKRSAATEEALKKLQQKQANLQIEISDVENKKNHLFKEFDAQKIFLNEKLEKEKSQMARSEEERLEEMRLEMSQRLAKMEQDLVEDVMNKKASMIRDIHIAVEKEVVQLVEVNEWNKIKQKVQEQIQEAVEGRVSSISQSSATQAKPADIVKKRKNEKVRWASMGLAAGIVIVFAGEIALDRVRKDSNPMGTRAQQEAAARAADLERRRFNPPQVDEMKDSYTDAVIYTRNFTATYGDNEFQQKFYKAASQYLLKTWRIDEDKSLQVLAAANATVKELQERRNKIHPDFIKDGIDKMRAFEKENVTRMKDILGSEVRLESFKRFEKNFYKEQYDLRAMAQQ
ncbi:FHA domain-containing protein [Bdellovibrio sp. KM01]|uniref:FHA domain-containing protein n=1 Tax=Bdellovibrio sp. KM01 TaxID=2748865 RepID=UPI0015EA911A|nr:FHA domain-containing protein [Bdellovibrio sp. KM01]QLY24464.1 FHA domain-containing protein [Bdellovibrio sp. KM01]